MCLALGSLRSITKLHPAEVQPRCGAPELSTTLSAERNQRQKKTPINKKRFTNVSPSCPFEVLFGRRHKVVCLERHILLHKTEEGRARARRRGGGIVMISPGKHRVGVFAFKTPTVHRPGTTARPCAKRPCRSGPGLGLRLALVGWHVQEGFRGYSEPTRAFQE